MLFYQIGQGRLALDFQKEFEEAQEICFEKNGKVTLKLEVVVEPIKEDCFGDISYSISKKLPKYDSRKFTTEVRNNRIVDDGTSVADVLQENLFEDDNVISMEKDGTHHE